ncbi:MAG: hypothetical protein HYV26_24685, partial [Candidatus Hydrogenedentes bacterium]|nr:hypothetical protein [Candidatus Hydrogenedentota bacterium]
MFSRTHVPRLVSTWLRWHVIPLLFLFPLFLAPAAVIEGDNAGVLRNAVLQNTAARQRVQSYIINQERSDLEPYQVDRPFDASAAADGLPAGPPPEDITRTSSMKIIKKGERYLLTRTQHATVPSGKWEMREFYQEVLNDHYYAFYMREPLHLIDLWDHPSIGIMGDPAKRFSSSGCPTAFDYAFGEPSHTLDKLLDESPEDVRWSLTEETLDGDKVLKIVKTRPIKDGRKWITNFYLDPNKDSLLRRMELFSPKGTLNRLLTLELQYIE